MKNVKKHLGWFMAGALVMVCLGFTVVEGLRVRTPGSVGQPGIGKVLMATTSEGDVGWTNQIALQAGGTGITLHTNGQTVTISNNAAAGVGTTNEFRGARILKTTSSQSIPANTATLVTFNTVVFDTDNMTTSANQLTMPRDGYYHITAQLYWNASGAGTSNFLRQTTIRIGGSVGKDIGGEINYQVDNELCMQSASAVIYMLASDPVTVMATHTRSAAETILVDATFDGCFLEAVYLGAGIAPVGDSHPDLYVGNLTVTNNIGFQVGTVAGTGGANTNFTIQAKGDESIIYLNAGTTNVNFVALMGWSSTMAYRGTVILTNRTATARLFSLGAITNNWISLQQFDGITAPFTVTNAQAGRFDWEIFGTNVQYSYKPMALPAD